MVKSINPADLAKLTNIPLTAKQAEILDNQFSSTLDIISTLNELNTADIQATPQVTNLNNVYREDVIDTRRTFSQKQALANASSTHQGYFLVKAVINES